MAKVKVTRAVTIVPNETSTVHYPEGYEGAAPKEHVEQIVKAGAGQEVGSESAKAKARDEK